MKKFIAFLLAMLLLTGCSADRNQNETQSPAASDAQTETVSETDGLDVPMTEEEAAAAQAAKAAELEERAKTKSMPLGDFTATTVTGETVDQTVFANADLTVIYLWATYLETTQADLELLAALQEDLGSDVQILGIVADCTDSDGSVLEAQVITAKTLAETAKCNYQNLILDDTLAELGFGAVSAIPATMFIDKEGNTVGEGFYGSQDEDGWREIIQERLEIAQARYE